MLHQPIEQRLARFATALLLRPLATANTNTGGGSSVVATVQGYYCSSISTRFASSSSLVPPPRLPAAAAVAGPCRCALSLSPGTPPSTTASSGTPRCSSSIGAAPPPRWGSSRPGTPKTACFGTPRCSSSSIVGAAAAAAATQQGSFWRAINRGGGAIVEGEERRGVAGRRKPRVVIIGAGMAGIAAAQQLQNVAGTGMYDLTILEASDRIGGRIWSSEFNGEGIELGATWIHGIEGSPLYKTAVQIGAMQNSERAWEGKDGFLQFNNALVKAEGGLDVARELVEPVVEAYKQLLQEAQEMEVVQPKEMVAGAVAIDTAPGKMSDLLCNCTSVGDFLRHGMDRFLCQQQQASNHHQASRISALAEEDPAEATCGSPRWTTKSLQEGCFKLHENLERNITSADDLYDIDLVDYNEYLEFPGEHKTVGKGYSSVVHALASCLPPGVVQFGQKVEKIVWSDSCRYSEAPVNIHCHGGSVVEADHVIITVSLGVLKARTLASLETNMNAGNSAFPSRILAAAECDSKMNSSMSGKSSEDGDDKKAAELPTAAEELFDPPLPMWKLDSISRLGFGVVDKVFVQNEPPAEGGEHQAVQFVFHPRRGEEAGEQQQHHSNVPKWMRKTFSLYPIHKKSHALVAWFAGREALQVESLSDDEILGGISKTLASFGIPENEQGTFLGIRRSQWGQNPLFRGSYSYVKVGSTGDDIDTLAEPLPKLVGDGGAAPLQVLFAGEATHRHYYSTTHGAYFSGLREAERLLQHYGLLGQR